MIEGEARVSEIARLLGGDSTSAAAITNARELIESLGNG
jgi:DNA repair ATPase RecN